MVQQVTLVIVGGAISLASAVAGILLKYWLDILQSKSKMREYPAHVLYDKQTAFYDELAKLLPKINSYITEIDVWLGEDDARDHVAEAADKNQAITKLDSLLGKYYMYLPKRILSQAKVLFVECLFLRNSQTFERVKKCLDLLFDFENTVRTYIGIDTISRDLMKAFGKSSELRKPSKPNTEYE